MKSASVTITGLSPLLMHSARGLDPLDPLKKESSAITGKRGKKKTDQDVERLLEIDWRMALYINADGPFIPEMNVLGSLRDGARKQRLGKEVMSAVVIDPSEIRLEYKGPRAEDALFAVPAFRDTRRVAMNGKGVIRCRPRFNEWSLNFEIQYDQSIIDAEQIKKSLVDAGLYVGIGDFRPRFGRFEVTTWKA